MRSTFTVGAALSAALLVGSALAADLKSGPQPGEGLTPFNPLHVNGPDTGKKVCLVWKNGNNPVAVVFAREISDPLTSLVKKLDEATAANSSCKMGSFVVFCSKEEGLEKNLKELVSREKLKKTILTIDNPTGPSDYNIAKDADVTVILYVNKTSKVNYSFKKGEFKQADVDKILADLPKILPDKKGK